MVEVLYWQAQKLRLYIIGNGEPLKAVGESYEYVQVSCKYHLLHFLL